MRKLLLLGFLLVAPSAFAEEPLPPAEAPLRIALSREEATALVQLLDVAVKACGLNCAAQALSIVAKIQTELEKQ